MKRSFCFAAALLLVAALSPAASPPAETVTLLRVIDGDTLRVWDGATETTVRLIGIDCPETRRNDKAKRDAAEWRVPVEGIIRAGVKARAFTQSVAPPGIEVAVTAAGEDAYGRTLAYVSLPDGRSLNELLLRAGAALAPARYRHGRREEYAELERKAREERRGFWKTLWKDFR